MASKRFHKSLSDLETLVTLLPKQDSRAVKLIDLELRGMINALGTEQWNYSLNYVLRMIAVRDNLEACAPEELFRSRLNILLERQVSALAEDAPGLPVFLYDSHFPVAFCGFHSDFPTIERELAHWDARDYDMPLMFEYQAHCNAFLVSVGHLLCISHQYQNPPVVITTMTDNPPVIRLILIPQVRKLQNHFFDIELVSVKQRERLVHHLIQKGSTVIQDTEG
ncbi:MAG: hypothetical protein Q9184_006599, partial [Pyrenodesmia sp. 2 TL-2023]